MKTTKEKEKLKSKCVHSKGQINVDLMVSYTIFALLLMLIVGYVVQMEKPFSSSIEEEKRRMMGNKIFSILSDKEHLNLSQKCDHLRSKINKTEIENIRLTYTINVLNLPERDTYKGKEINIVRRGETLKISTINTTEAWFNGTVFFGGDFNVREEKLEESDVFEIKNKTLTYNLKNNGNDEDTLMITNAHFAAFRNYNMRDKIYIGDNRYSNSCEISNSTTNQKIVFYHSEYMRMKEKNYPVTIKIEVWL